MSYFHEPYNRSKKELRVELDLSHYATKFGLKTATGVDISEFVKKIDLADLKSDVDKLDIDKLKKCKDNI